MENDIVEFWFKNTRKDSIWETTTLPVMEFIKRFLPNGKAGANITKIRQDLAVAASQDPTDNSG